MEGEWCRWLPTLPRRRLLPWCWTCLAAIGVLELVRVSSTDQVHRGGGLPGLHQHAWQRPHCICRHVDLRGRLRLDTMRFLLLRLLSTQLALLLLRLFDRSIIHHCHHRGRRHCRHDSFGDRRVGHVECKIVLCHSNFHLVSRGCHHRGGRCSTFALLWKGIARGDDVSQL